ncbi:MAG: hypothetical protein LUO93_01060, partial [Methanomicrobiales archaeon]|nr:hypothetical protein [Methanomicrobiales archaeon]
MSSALASAEPVLEYWELDEPVDEAPLLPRQAPIDWAAADEAEDLRAQFDLLSDELEEAAAVLSSTRRAMRHPAYLGILAMGEDAIPLLIKRLEVSRKRPILLRLLGSLTTFQPGAGRETISDATRD